MHIAPPHDRRHFLRLAAGFSLGGLLAGCGSGGGGGSASVPEPVVSAPVIVVPAPPVANTPTHPLNLALMLSYLGGQYYAVAARGTGLSPALTGGVGTSGIASGARQVTFTDPSIASLAADLADDKAAHVAALRNSIGAAAAAQPAIDLSSGTTSAFSVAAQRAGIVAAGQSFDPYVDDDRFLLGGFLIENAVAATYRTLLFADPEGPDAAAMTTQLGDAIYHGGAIRALLDDRIAANPAMNTTLDKVSAMLATLDATNVGDQSLAGVSGASSNVLDADGRPIPFTRSATQVLSALYLSNARAGGFLPNGANGVA